MQPRTYNFASELAYLLRTHKCAEFKNAILHVAYVHGRTARQCGLRDDPWCRPDMDDQDIALSDMWLQGYLDGRRDQPTNPNP
jgi:hypothetical protein